MKYIFWLGCVTVFLFCAACRHNSSSSSAVADSAEVNIDSLLNQAKAAVDSLPAQEADSLHPHKDSIK
ncbi:hypothetical protein [Thermoflavifilum thermophilum]|uniref:Uncharacterized protein n=1 Tax=Thermoflavifilum thermophilum TaxID=1393122 RepID=A0A1I7NM69_9BACT|nr:hypothetical protein [Thermoflavifilum thermophilum]SFV35670.1 hypothetical protein SAMN05660895_2285 [Thermoflavifilum thermophilum]